MSETKGGGFDPEQMKKQFTDIWKQTVEQLEDIREAVVRASQTARERLDATFLRRERDRLYQQLGEDTFVLIESGKLRAPEALKDLLERIHVIGQQLHEAEEQEAAERDDGTEPSPRAAAADGKKAAAAPEKKTAPKKKAAARKTTGKKKTAKKKTAARKKPASRKKST